MAAVAANDVWAVGYTYSDNHYTLLHWNGATWTQVPANAGGATRLFAVAAVSANEVWAVGSRNTGTATLTMRWNGSAWSVVPSPNGDYSAANQHSLVSVAVISNQEIWAVGSSANSGLCGGSDASNYQTQTLALRWNGSTWQQAQTVNPGASNGCNTPRNDFYGVTTAGGKAIAVGAYFEPAQNVQFYLSLVERSQ